MTIGLYELDCQVREHCSRPEHFLFQLATLVILARHRHYIKLKKKQKTFQHSRGLQEHNLPTFILLIIGCGDMTSRLPGGCNQTFDFLSVGGTGRSEGFRLSLEWSLI